MRTELLEPEIVIELPRGTVVCEDMLKFAIAEVRRVAREMRYWPRERVTEFGALATLVLWAVGLDSDTAESVAEQVWNAVQEEHHA